MSSPRLAVVCGVAISASLALAACGSSDTDSPTTTSQSSILQPAEISRPPQDSAERAFLQFWSNLQFRSWAEVPSYYDPELRDTIGTTRLIKAKRTGASVYPTLRPESIRSGSRDGITTVYYTVRPEGEARETASTSWRREGGNWLMIYDSRLDPELAQLAQERVQYEQEGADGSETLSPEALQAGKVAADTQARFLGEQLEAATP